MSTSQELEIPGVPHPQPFPHGVKVGNIIFSSGIDPVDPATGKPAEGIERQAEQVFRNLRRKTIPFDFGSSGIRVQLQIMAVL